MSAMSDYLETQIIKYWFQNDGTAASKPANLYVGLFTATPNDAGGGTEVSTSGTNYARATVAASAANWSSPTGNNGTTANLNTINFGAPSGNWGSIVAFGIFDALSGGNLLWWGALDIAKTVNNGDAAPSFAASALSIQVDN